MQKKAKESQNVDNTRTIFLITSECRDVDLMNFMKLSEKDLVEVISKCDAVFHQGTYLATGLSSLTELQYNFRIGVTTFSIIINSVCKAIWDVMKEQCIPKPTEESWLKIAKGFLQNANFPYCIGAIDGKHIRIIKPAHSGSLYFNYKSFFSLACNVRLRLLLYFCGCW
ncbi:hypothetical protein HUJ04_010900 [Dendroctonus ponderosae]|nr:hypothetical protein HUJ04_010900 [Dendroctonus ponderosae]